MSSESARAQTARLYPRPMLVCALFGGADLLISRLIDSRSRFVFLHIPKTAGSSIIAFFQDVFGRDAVWAHGQNFEISELTRDIPPHIRMICGHFRLSDEIGSAHV